MANKEIFLKELLIDGNVYLFCSEDFELFEIVDNNNVSEIKNKIFESKCNVIGTNDTTQIFDIDLCKRGITSISLGISKGCTLACKYCYVSAFESDVSKMTTDKFCDILSFFDDIKQNQITFHIIGDGEPTINYSLLEKIPHLCKQHGYNNCKFEITTNGTLLSDKLARCLLKDDYLVYVSLDGGVDQNVNRIFPNGEGSFNAVYTNIRRARQIGLDVICKTVIDPNYSQLLKVFSFFEEEKLPFTFSFISNSFDGHFSPQINDISEFSKQMDAVCQMYARLIRQNKMLFCKTIINDLKRIHRGTIFSYGCKAVRNGVYINLDGDIYTCTYHSSSEQLKIGSIYRQIDYEKVKANGYYAQPVDSYTKCKQCWMKHLCAGACFAIKWLETGNTYTPSDYTCQLNEVYWCFIIKLYVRVIDCIADGQNLNFG